MWLLLFIYLSGLFYTVNIVALNYSTNMQYMFLKLVLDLDILSGGLTCTSFTKLTSEKKNAIEKKIFSCVFLCVLSEEIFCW